MNIIDFMNTEK